MDRRLISFAAVSGWGEPVTVEFTWGISGFHDEDGDCVRTFTGRGVFENVAEAEAYARERGLK